MIHRFRLVLSCAALLAAGSVATSAQQVAAPSIDSTWWKHAVIYEIYPRSFGDSNGDGVGDLNGITAHLDYLQWLGVDAIWIAPIYPSPQIDFGYDISDYRSVDPQYGTLKDFDLLQSEAKKRHIRLLMDMVLNHTSNKHAWFVESASSRANPTADWYVWSDGAKPDAPGVTAFQKKFEHEGRVPPNNWISLMGGSAWEWVPARKQFYYHVFYKQQPDLNWRNPAVEKAMMDTMRFWLDRGVDGFRLDALPTIYEDPQMRNEPETGGVNEDGTPVHKAIYTRDLEDQYALMRRIRAMIATYPGDRVLIGETNTATTSGLDKWYGGTAQDELQLPMDLLFGFGPLSGSGRQLKVPEFRQMLTEIETEVHGSQPLLVFDNHDRERSMDRFGDGVHNVAIAKTLATVLFTARATALTYYGAEIGMVTTLPTRKEDLRDPVGIRDWPKPTGRDGERTPMQWTPGPQAGFSMNPGTWLAVPPSAARVNVETEMRDPQSLLLWDKKLIELRRTVPALRDGGMVMLNRDDADVLAYVRTGSGGGKSVMVAVNMSATSKTVKLDLAEAKLHGSVAHTLAASDASLQNVTTLDAVTLPAFAVWIASIE